MTELLDQFTATLLAPDAGLPVRLTVLALALILLWRFFYLIAQKAPPRPRSPVQGMHTPAPVAHKKSLWARLFPAPIERLERDNQLQRAQLDHTEIKVALMRARAEMRDLEQQVNPLPPPPAPEPAPCAEPAPPALTYADIERAVAMCAFPAPLRDEFLSLIDLWLKERAS